MSAYLSQFSTGMATLRSGGPMLIPLLFLSLAATAIVLDRLAILRRGRFRPPTPRPTRPASDLAVGAWRC